MGRIITLANQKGGVGKTTTAINLSSFIARKGNNVLLIDNDPQGNAGSGLGINIHEVSKTIYEILIGDVSASEAIINTEVTNLSILPSNVNLSGIEVDMLQMEDRDFRLKNAISSIKKIYDYIIIDCPPNLGILTLNALTAADGVIITLQTEYYALEGLTQLMTVIDIIQKSINPSLVLDGVVLTMFDQRTSLAKQVVDDVRNHFGSKVYNSIIPRNIKLSEAPSFGKFIGDYASDSAGAAAYKELAEEVLSRG